jgi:parvulin-like peptidyl-prolyl isomerase
MRFSTKTRFVVVLLLAFAALPASAQEVIDRIAARVDTDIILLSDIRALARYQLFLDGQSEPDQQILDRLVDQWIVRNEAKAALFPQPSDEDVKRSLERLKRSFSSPEEFDARKKQSGLTDEDVDRMLRSQLYLSNYLDSRFRASIQIDEKDIETFYKSRVVPRAESRGQQPPSLDAARGFIQEALVQRAINVQSERWLKESRARVRVEGLLNEDSKEGAK